MHFNLQLAKLISISFVIVLFVAILLFSIVYAHVPLQGEGYGIEDAVVINEPLKSWVIYTEYEDAQPLYYKFDLLANDRLKTGLLTVDKDFIPDLTILGPGLPDDFEEHFHEEFEIPEGYGLLHIHGEKQANKMYEPFTPSSYYMVLDLDLKVNEAGTYFLVVDATTGSGKVGIVLGYIESFTLVEWLKVPFDVAFIHNWEGQDYLIILLPMIIIVVGGLLINGYFFKLSLDGSQILAFAGSLTYFGSGAIVLHQMIIALVGSTYNTLLFMTLIFILLPVLLGFSIIRKATKRDLSIGQEIRLLLYGLVGLFFWAGYIVGPILVIISVLVKVIKRKKGNMRRTVEMSPL
ncbi:hypothetical protein ACFLRN_09030 [Thermoproteota archaeon]